MKVSQRAQIWYRIVSFLMVFSAFGAGIYFGIIEEEVFLGLGAILLATVALPWYISARNGRIELFEPIIYHSVFIGMLTILWIDLAIISRTPFRYDTISMTFRQGYLLAGGALLVLSLSALGGYYLMGPIVTNTFSSAGPQIKQILSLPNRASGNQYRIVGGLYMLVGLCGLASIVYFLYPNNNIFYMFTSTDPRSQVFAGNGFLVLVSRSLYIGYFLWICGSIVDGKTPAITELLLSLPISAGYLLLGGRGQALSIMVITTILVYYTVIEDIFSVNKGILAKLTNYIPSSILLLLLPLIGVGIAMSVVVLRGARLGLSIMESAKEMNPLSLAHAGVHDDQFDNFLALVEVVPEQFGYYYGSFYVRAVLNFIPRAIWPGKPVSTSGGMLRRSIHPDGTGGYPPGAMGEYYLNFGFIGIPLLGALYGMILYASWGLVRGERVGVFSLLLFALVMPRIAKNGLVNNALIEIFEELVVLLPAFVLIGFLGYYRSHDQPLLSTLTERT